MIKDKSFYKIFFTMFFALVLQNVITISVNLADNLMLGAYSEVALSGVAAVNQIQFVYQQALMALGDGLVIFCTQYWGKQQFLPMKKIAACAMQLSWIIAIVLFAAISIFPGEIVGWFTTDAAIVEQGVAYINILKYSYLFFAVTVILLATLRSVEIVNIALILSIVTFCVNCGINYVLIYGQFGAPEMGVRGAAIGTVAARIIECLVCIWFVFFKEKKLHMRPKDFLLQDASLRKDYLKLTMPILLVQILWGLNTALQTAILGHMTSAAIAANSVASTLFMMVKSMSIGAASAASIMVGKAIGVGDMKAVKEYAKTMQIMFVGIGILSGIALYLLRLPILNLYDLSPDTRAMADIFLIILSVVCAFQSYQMPVNIGIIRGGGSSMFVVKLDIISIWCIVIPVSFFVAFVLKASPAIVVCCLNADQIFKCVPAWLMVNHGNWVKKLTRE